MNPLNAMHVLRGRLAWALRPHFLHMLFLTLAFVTAIPIAWNASERIVQVRIHAREQFIRIHRLWELHPEYQGTPATWTRFAARLLTDGQIMRRVTAKYGALSEQIEHDYQRDLAIAESEVVFAAIGRWALPLVVVYAIGFAFLRWSRRTPKAATKAASSLTDPRYLPQGANNNDRGAT